MYLYLRGTFQGRLCESLGCHPSFPSEAVPVHMLWPQSPFSVIYTPLQAPSPLSLPLSSSLTSLWLFFPVYQGFVDVSSCSSQYEQHCLWWWTLAWEGGSRDESHGEKLWTRSLALRRMLSGTSAFQPQHKCSVCTPKSAFVTSNWGSVGSAQSPGMLSIGASLQIMQICFPSWFLVAAPFPGAALLALPLPRPCHHCHESAGTQRRVLQKRCEVTGGCGSLGGWHRSMRGTGWGYAWGVWGAPLWGAGVLGCMWTRVEGTQERMRCPAVACEGPQGAHAAWGEGAGYGVHCCGM